MRQRLLPAVLAVLVLAGPAAASPFTPHADRVDRVLTDLGVDRAKVRLIDYVAQHTAGRSSRIDFYQAFVSFSHCKGNLVIDLDRAGHVRQVYTRGDCRVDGVPAY